MSRPEQKEKKVSEMDPGSNEETDQIDSGRSSLDGKNSTGDMQVDPSTTESSSSDPAETSAASKKRRTGKEGPARKIYPKHKMRLRKRKTRPAEQAQGRERSSGSTDGSTTSVQTEAEPDYSIISTREYSSFRSLCRDFEAKTAASGSSSSLSFALDLSQFRSPAFQLPRRQLFPPLPGDNDDEDDLEMIPFFNRPPRGEDPVSGPFYFPETAQSSASDESDIADLTALFSTSFGELVDDSEMEEKPAARSGQSASSTSGVISSGVMLLKVKSTDMGAPRQQVETIVRPIKEPDLTDQIRRSSTVSDLRKYQGRKYLPYLVQEPQTLSQSQSKDKDISDEEKIAALRYQEPAGIDISRPGVNIEDTRNQPGSSASFFATPTIVRPKAIHPDKIVGAEPILPQPRTTLHPWNTGSPSAFTQMSRVETNLDTGISTVSPIMETTLLKRSRDYCLDNVEFNEPKKPKMDCDDDVGAEEDKDDHDADNNDNDNNDDGNKEGPSHDNA